MEFSQTPLGTFEYFADFRAAHVDLWYKQESKLVKFYWFLKCKLES